MGTRVNRPQSIFYDQAIREKLSADYKSNIYDVSILMTEWSMAAAAIVAFSELFPDNQNLSYRSEQVLADDFARERVNVYRTNKL